MVYMYFRRSEFCREVTFRNFGSQRPEFNFNDMSDIVIPLPDMISQQKYVDIYNAIANIYDVYNERININEKLKAQIKDICPILIKGSIEEAM